MTKTSDEMAVVIHCSEINQEKTMQRLISNLVFILSFVTTSFVYMSPATARLKDYKKLPNPYWCTS